MWSFLLYLVFLLVHSVSTAWQGFSGTGKVLGGYYPNSGFYSSDIEYTRGNGLRYNLSLTVIL